MNYRRLSYRICLFAVTLIGMAKAGGLVVAFDEENTEREKPAKSSSNQPNILFIAIDDQNDWIGCMGGHPQVRTPHIDRLASRGTVFLNAHCQSPLCNSSRTSLLTGRRPSSTGIYGLAPDFKDVPDLQDIVSLPQYLKENGYHTMLAGKIYHGGYGHHKHRDEFDVLGPQTRVLCKPEQKLVDTPSDHPLVDWGTFPHRDEDKNDYKIASWAVDQLNEKPTEPFCMALGFFLPHVPCYATQEWFDLYPGDKLKLPPLLENDRDDTPRFSWFLHWKLPEPRLKFLQESDQHKNLVRSYMACTSFVDSQVGRVLDALKRNELADNTIVVLWSDHGWHLGEKQITGKNTLWERSTRVPLIFSGPGTTIGGRCTEPAELLDIYPTLAELCRLPVSRKLEGHSLVPQLADVNAERAFPAITTHNHDNHSIRTKRWRYIQYADGSNELYDMKVDPNEWTNLANEDELQSVVEQHVQWLPKLNRKPVEGSQHRILIYDGTKANWEGADIGEEDPIPEL